MICLEPYTTNFWDEHHVSKLDTGESLLYIDRHFIHEVTSPQAFEGLLEK